MRFAKIPIALEYLSTVYLAESGSIYQWKPEGFALEGLPCINFIVLFFSKYL